MMGLPVLTCFPTTDARFRRDAVEALRALARPDDRQLESVLRRWYPACVVRPQNEFASLNRVERWYIYRDGSARPRFVRSERLYDALGRSRDLIASTLTAVDRAARSPAVDARRVRTRVREFHRRFDDRATRPPTE